MSVTFARSDSRVLRVTRHGVTRGVAQANARVRVKGEGQDPGQGQG